MGGSYRVWGVQVAPLYGVWGSALENFVFWPYISLGGPTYGFVHDLSTWFWTRWFSVHSFGCNGFRSMVLDASACINMYCNIERNIMKNQAGSPSFGIQGEISMYMCFMCYALTLFIFCVLESYAGNFCTGLKPTPFGIMIWGRGLYVAPKTHIYISCIRFRVYYI